MKRILRMIGPPVETERRNSNHLFITGRKHHWAATCRTHMRSSTKRIFLLSPSIAFISASEREKSNICGSTTEHFEMHFLFYTQHDDVICCLSCATHTNLKVLLDASRVEALRDDHHSSLQIEPQGHLGCGLVILFSN